MSGMSTRRKERGASPDSTTQLKQLEVGDEVLCHGKDGLYYFGFVDVVDDTNDKVRVKFDDHNAGWSLKKDVKKLKSVNEPRCSVCDSSCAFPSNNTVLVCSTCSTPYHQRCHQPVIPSPPPKRWVCKKCDENDPKKQAMKTELPYDMGSLSWDSRHRVNGQQVYCYCGGPGEWNQKMLQCRRCKQWFHEACIDCLDHPLLLGDGLYVFVCRLCNEGEEFVHRLELRWEDIVHLVIYNLTVLNSYIFHDLHDSILPYLNDNWERMKIPSSIVSCSTSKRLEKVEHVLQTTKNRFSCGRDKHKKSTMWGLRKREVAPTPTVILPPGKINHSQVPKFKIIWDKRWKSTNGRVSSPELADSESEMQKSEQDSLYDSSDDQVYVPKRKAKDRKKAKDIEKLLTMPTPPPVRLKLRPRPDTSDQSEASSHKPVANGQPEHKDRGRRRLFDKGAGGGDSDSYSETVRIINDKTVIRIRRKRRREESKDSEESRKSNRSLRNAEKNGGLRRATKKRESVQRSVSGGESSDEETSSRGTLDSFIPAPLDFEGPNNPFRALIDPAMKNVKKEEDKRHYRRRKEVQPATKYASLSPAAKYPRAQESSEDALVTSPSSSMEFLTDLKCSVNSFFGASNRLSSGENCTVLARRVCADSGRVQYLLEWDT